MVNENEELVKGAQNMDNAVFHWMKHQPEKNAIGEIVVKLVDKMFSKVTETQTIVAF